MNWHWANEFVGIPFKDKGRSIEGCDCWGLVQLVYARFGVTIPSYLDHYSSPDERSEVDAIINREKANPNWVKVVETQQRDVIVFRVGRFDSHVGLILDPTAMLHMAVGDCAKIENFTQPKWASRRVGVYRWKEQS